jgi:hypothetical protein
MKVLFRAEFATGYPDKSKLEIEHEKKIESFAISDKKQPIWMELLVPAGVSRMSLRSGERRVATPGDPRFLVFATYNWKIYSREGASGDSGCER